MLLKQIMDTFTKPIILSYFSLDPFFQALEDRVYQFEISPDLGLTKIKASIEGDSIIFPGNRRINRNIFESIRSEPQSCFEVDEYALKKIAVYSEYTNRYYSLYPTQAAPTMLLSGIPMHRIKETDPFTDTQTKIRAANPMGVVLDTTTGLGYTAIASARKANHVITIELDPAVLKLCKRNPWSKDLFDHPRISKVVGDSFDIIQIFPDEYFSCVIHDPPTFSLAGDLYSTEFYGQVYRVLKPNGRLFHYIGDPNSQSGRRITQGVTKRLSNTGFKHLTPRPEAFGLLAQKR